MSIPQAALETTLVEKFRRALTPEMVDYLVAATNTTLKTMLDAAPREVQPLEDEQKRISAELSNLVDFVVKGNSRSPRLLEEIRVRERRLTDLEEQIRTLRRISGPLPEIDRCWVEMQVGKLVDLLARDPVAARLEIQRHIEDLRIEPAPEAGERVVRVTGRPKVDGLLEGEEAVRLQLVAGAGYAKCYTAPETHWIDLK
jgi:hypothetical protein